MIAVTAALLLPVPVLTGSGGAPLQVKLATGQKLRAVLDSRTSADRLWLRFGNDTTSVTRGIDWHQVVEVTQGGGPVSRAELIGAAPASPGSPDRHGRVIQIPPGGPNLQPAVAPRSSPAETLASVTCDAQFHRWDVGPESDGLLVQITAWDRDGLPVAARGTLIVELYSSRRVPFHSQPTGRGRDFQRVESWTTTVAYTPRNESSGRVRLPFRTYRPEQDPNWSSVSLVHARLAVPGHGVFRDSVDGVSMRPYAPTRDLRQLHGSSRFFPGELN